MRREFRAGDRVRVTAGGLASGYLPGSPGTVLSGKEALLQAWDSYYVRMDGEPVGAWVLMAAGWIEAAAGDPQCAAPVSPGGAETASASPAR